MDYHWDLMMVRLMVVRRDVKMVDEMDEQMASMMAAWMDDPMVELMELWTAVMTELLLVHKKVGKKVEWMDVDLVDL